MSESKELATQLVVRAYTNGEVEVGLPGDVVSALRLLEIAVKAMADKVEQAKKGLIEEVRA